MESKGKLTNLNVMDYIVIIVISSVLVFIGVSLYFYYKFGIPVSEMYPAIFSFFGVELLAMAGISISGNRVKKKIPLTELEQSMDITESDEYRSYK